MAEGFIGSSCGALVKNCSVQFFSPFYTLCLSTTCTFIDLLMNLMSCVSPVSPAVGAAAVYSNTNRHVQSHEPQGVVR